MQVRILDSSPSTVYTQDFMLCLDLGNSYGCTGWASEVGFGDTGQLRNGGSIKQAAVRVWTREMPVPGMTLTNVRVGAQLFYQKNNDACRGSSGMQFSSGSESAWAYGEQQDNDPGCGKLAFSVTQVVPPDAQYVSDTVPRAADPSASFASSITMRNTGYSWNSDNILVPEQNGCEAYLLANGHDGDTCNDSYVVESTNWVLKRTDQTAVTAPETLRYRRAIGVTYTFSDFRFCEEGSGGPIGPQTVRDGSSSPLSWLMSRVIPTALAVRNPSDPICTTFRGVTRSETPYGDVFRGYTADFPIALTVPAAAGAYELKYQMYRVDQAQLFGETARMPIVVGSGGPQEIGLSCQTISQTVTAGQAASYAVSVTPRNGFAGPVSIEVASGLPANTTSPGATVNVTASTTANAIVPVLTTASTPASTSTLVLRATAQGVTPQQCTSQLIVRRADTPPQATLTVSPSTQRVPVGVTGSYTASYDPDGPQGPQAAQDVTAQAAWSAELPQIGQSTGGGSFRGVAEGQTRVFATYQQVPGNALLVVGDDDPAAIPSLVLQPDEVALRPGEQGSFRAYYDADGPFRDEFEPVEVTAQSAWVSGAPSIATSQGGGVYRGVADGSTYGEARYAIPAGSPTRGGYEPGDILAASGSIVVDDDAGVASFDVLPGSATMRVGETRLFRAYYDADGPLRRAVRPIDVSSSATWSSSAPSTASSQGNGSYRGERIGSAQASASYQPSSGALLSDTADIAVAETPDPGAGAATFQVQPGSATIQVGAQTSFRAYYDADGPEGRLRPVDVSAQAQWSSDETATASSLGNGTYRGNSVGRTTARAEYAPETGAAMNGTAGITVVPVTGGGGECTFSASPTSLFVPPARSTTLSWSCEQPTTCTVGVIDTPRAGTQVTAGGQSGSGSDAPPFSTTYRLGCANGVQKDLRVRVFDVTTRVEILPR